MKNEPILQIICQKDRTSREIPLESLKGECLIGRKQDCQIILTDDEVSGHHAILTRKGNLLVIQDNGSTNGIKVQKQKVESAKLKLDGDDVQIGSYIFRLKRPEPRHTLKFLNGNLKGKTFDITGTPFNMGSSKTDNDLVIPDPGVSHSHAWIELSGSGKSQEVWLHTSEITANGTWVEKQKLTDGNKRLLKDGQIINLAATRIRFQNAYAWHFDVNLGLIALSLFLTVVVAGIAWVIWDRTRPTAEYFINMARELAKIEQFDLARRSLAKAQTARHYKDHIGICHELDEKIDEWEKTAINWKRCKFALSKENLIEARQMIGTLDITQQMAWAWNEPKSTNEMERARKLAECLKAVSMAEAVLTDKDADVESLSQKLDGLRNVKGNIVDIHRAAPYKTDTNKDEEEAFSLGLDKLEDRIARLSNALSTNIDLQEQMDKRLKALESLKEDGYGNLIAFLHDTAARTTGRIQTQAESLIAPLEKLQKAHLQISAAKKSLGELDFQWLDKSPQLPTPEECGLNEYLSDHRKRLEETFNVWHQAGESLKSNVQILLKNGLTLEQEPPFLKEIASENLWEDVLKCDAFQKEPPKEGRREPTGKYDAVLGVEEFFQFITSLDESEFSKPEFDDKSFKPLIYEVFDAYDKYQWFQNILTKSTQQWPNGGKLRAARNFLEEMEKSRRELVDRLWNKNGQDREAVLAHGAAILLDNKNRFGKAEREKVEAELKNLRQEIGALERKYKMLITKDENQAIAVRHEILKKAIPGMGQAKSAWTHELQARKRN